MAANRKAVVVVVDDEEMVITSIRALVMLEGDYHFEGFADPEHAVRFLESNLADVVISDYLMPKMNGIQVLLRAKQAQAEASRVLLTGHADRQSAIQAINEVQLFQYLEKPWDNQQLLLVIKGGIERAQLFRELREKVSELDNAHSSLKEVQRRLIQAFL